MHFRGYQHVHWVYLLPKSPLRMTARNQKRKHWGREWFITNMAALRASFHTPSSLVCNAAESVNSSEDELPFNENIPLAAGYKEQDEDRGGDRRFSREKYEEQQWYQKTSNNNTSLTVKKKRIFCCISFLRLLEFCKSFTSGNLRWSLCCGAISSPLTAVLTTVRTLN